MRAWTTSACVVLAWTLMLAALAAAGLTGSARPAQATTRTTHSTTIILTSIHKPTTTSTTPTAPAGPPALAAPATPAALAALAVPAAPAVTGSDPATSPVTRYVVQPGDTLSGIAARFGIQGGWPPLYASNLKVIGWDPGLLHPGTVLVLPGPARARYTITAGDTLSGIAAGLGIRGGWPALYAANRQVIGSNPDALQPGTVLRLPRPAAAHPAGVTPPTRHPAPPPAPPAPAPVKHHRHPGTAATASAGMPPWLKTMLIALGLLILVALLTEPVLAALRRRQKAALQATGPAPAGQAGQPRPAPAGPLRPAPAAPERTSIVLADHDRLVVTCNKADETVYVLRPPGEDPRAILRVARLVLPEGPYWELARQLGVPAVEPVE
jgi:nucleoid-associated protein YgaU